MAPAGVAQREGLLHDARNLMGALGLYCDLLSSHGVLKAEHLHYAEEMRFLGVRSGALIDRLIGSLAVAQNTLPQSSVPQRASVGQGASFLQGASLAQSTKASRPESLREIASRCSGMLSRVAGGRQIELSYGPAAAAWTAAGREDVERILVNLVRNAAAALDAAAETASGGRPGSGAPSGLSADAVRIGIGMLENRVGDPVPWPFRRVRLTVEDSGCGMAPAQLERMLGSRRGPVRGAHGIGFRVVQELVADGGGDLRVTSAAGVGTRVQIEWPVWSLAGGAGNPVAEGLKGASC